MPGMDHGKKTRTVKGSDRPDLIPDEEAYRLVFATFAKTPEALRGISGLTIKDSKNAAAVIIAYQTTFESLLRGQGKTYDRAAQLKFMAASDDLVKRTRQELANHMTADGYDALEQFVQQAKSNMTITTVAE